MGLCPPESPNSKNFLASAGVDTMRFYSSLASLKGWSLKFGILELFGLLKKS